MSLRKPNDYAERDQADLVRLAQAGDREAFRAIMQRGNQRLFRIARGAVGDDAEAEDVLQEAYARAFAAIGGFRGEADVLTWLTRIVLNEARSRVRRRRPPTARTHRGSSHRGEHGGSGRARWSGPPPAADPASAAREGHGA